MSKDTQENPWPGFVDVLSSTLLVFVFLVIIQLLVIAGVSVKVSQTAIEQIKQQLLDQKQANAQEPIETSPKPVAENTKEVSNVKQQNEYDAAGPISLTSAKETLSITYNGLSTLLEEEGGEEIDQWIKARTALLTKSRIQLNAYLGSRDVSTSTAYYVSYNRMMDLRKRMVALGVPSANITVRIHETVEEDHNKVELWILESTP